jgi:hypothetical protein
MPGFAQGDGSAASMIIVVVSIVCNPDPFVEESWLRKGQVQSLSRMMPMNATDMMQFTTVYGLHEGHTAVFVLAIGLSHEIPTRVALSMTSCSWQTKKGKDKSGDLLEAVL